MTLNNNDLVFAKVRHDAIIPTKENENAGYDIYACFEEDLIVIPAHSSALVPTGIAAAVSDNYYLQIHERGSTGSKGMKYGAGVIDSSFRGEIFVVINNINEDDIIISKLTEEKLIEKYSMYDDYFHDYTIALTNGRLIYVIIDDDSDEKHLDAILYPYSKAIAQLVVHEVPKMNVSEISYNDLLSIPSKRQTGSLGSTGK